EDAFKLHDTYGFPIDLTQIMAEEKGMQVDVAEYERLMEGAKERARSGKTKDDYAQFVFEHREPTEFDPDSRADAEDCGVTVFDEAFHEGAALSPGKKGYLILSKTAFYAEQGGQVGDTGTIERHDGSWRFSVTNTKKFGRTFVHEGY